MFTALCVPKKKGKFRTMFIIFISFLFILFLFLFFILCRKNENDTKDISEDKMYVIIEDKYIEEKKFKAQSMAFEREREKVEKDNIPPTDKDLIAPAGGYLKVHFLKNKNKDIDYILSLENCSSENDICNFIFDFKKIEECKKVYDIVKKWKNTTFYICNIAIDKNEAGELIRCLLKQKEHGCKIWCDKIDLETGRPGTFGCRKIVGYMYHFPNWLDSEFLIEEDSRIRIDKNRILLKIKEQAKVFHYCPFFDSHKIWENFQKIPPLISYYDIRWIVVKWNKNGKIEVMPRGYLESWDNATDWIENATILSKNKNTVQKG